MPSAPITIFDGGMGTTLESLGCDISSCLWSSDPKLAGAVQSVHEGFIDAGAMLIGSSTYQAAASLYSQMDPKLEDDAVDDLMRSYFHVARRAAAKGQERGQAGVVLSLGPFGATLSPGQEYSGCYPPPYGPREWSSTEQNINTWSSSSLHELSLAQPPSALLASLSALREFHLARLLTYAADEPTWRAVDWIGFETIPLLREGVAVRQAMHALDEVLAERYAQGGEGEGRPWWRKRFWTSFVFPKGKAPDGASPREITQRMLEDRADERRPDGLGMNCTSPAFIGRIASEMTDGVSSLASVSSPSPAFVLYPDGGLVYDPVSKTWHAPTPAGTPASSGTSTPTALDPSSWAERVADVAQTTAAAARTDGEQTVWSEVIVGGCCKAGFAEIKALSQRVRAVDERI